MQTTDDMPVCVQREWDGWQTAEVRLGDLQHIHWFQPHRAPRPLAHGYVSCAHITAGDIPHNCGCSQGPHTLLVCVLKRHILPSVYAEIARRAEQQPAMPGGRAHDDDQESSPFTMSGMSPATRRAGRR
jgi:hypothetical protein